jgi:hypothetical protein
MYVRLLDAEDFCVTSIPVRASKAIAWGRTSTASSGIKKNLRTHLPGLAGARKSNSNLLG